MAQIRHTGTFLRSALVKDPFSLGDFLGPEDVLRIESEFPGLFNSGIAPSQAKAKVSLPQTKSSLNFTTPASGQPYRLPVIPKGRAKIPKTSAPQHLPTERRSQTCFQRQPTRNPVVHSCINRVVKSVTGLPSRKAITNREQANSTKAPANITAKLSASKLAQKLTTTLIPRYGLSTCNILPAAAQPRKLDPIADKPQHAKPTVKNSVKKGFSAHSLSLANSERQSPNPAASRSEIVASVRTPSFEKMQTMSSRVPSDIVSNVGSKLKLSKSDSLATIPRRKFLEGSGFIRPILSSIRKGRSRSVPVPVPKSEVSDINNIPQYVSKEGVREKYLPSVRKNPGKAVDEFVEILQSKGISDLSDDDVSHSHTDSEFYEDLDSSLGLNSISHEFQTNLFLGLPEFVNGISGNDDFQVADSQNLTSVEQKLYAQILAMKYERDGKIFKKPSSLHLHNCEPDDGKHENKSDEKKASELKLYLSTEQREILERLARELIHKEIQREQLNSQGFAQPIQLIEPDTRPMNEELVQLFRAEMKALIETAMGRTFPDNNNQTVVLDVTNRPFLADASTEVDRELISTIPPEQNIMVMEETKETAEAGNQTSEKTFSLEQKLPKMTEDIGEENHEVVCNGSKTNLGGDFGLSRQTIIGLSPILEEKGSSQEIIDILTPTLEIVKNCRHGSFIESKSERIPRPLAPEPYLLDNDVTDCSSVSEFIYSEIKQTTNTDVRAENFVKPLELDVGNFDKRTNMDISSNNNRVAQLRCQESEREVVSAPAMRALELHLSDAQRDDICPPDLRVLRTVTPDSQGKSISISDPRRLEAEMMDIVFEHEGKGSKIEIVQLKNGNVSKSVSLSASLAVETSVPIKSFELDTTEGSTISADYVCSHLISHGELIDRDESLGELSFPMPFSPGICLEQAGLYSSSPELDYTEILGLNSENGSTSTSTD